MEIILSNTIDKIIYTSPLINNNIIKMKACIIDNSEYQYIKPIIKTPIILNTQINWIDNDKILMNILLEPLNGPNIELLKLIEDLEEKAEEILNKKFTEIESFKTNIIGGITVNKETPLKLGCILFNNIDIYDDNNNKIDKKTISNKILNYQFMIEYKEIWYDTIKKIGGCNLNIIQGKIYPNYYERNLFNNKPIQNISNKLPPSLPSLPSLPPPPPIIPNKQYPRLQLDPNDLIEMKGKLKKVI